MSNLDYNGQLAPALPTDPRAELERAFIETYLNNKGFTWQSLKTLPKKRAHQLRIATSIYASCRLAEIEARSALVEKMHSIFMS